VFGLKIVAARKGFDDEYDIVDADGKTVRSNETTYRVRAYYRAEVLNRIRRDLNANMDRQIAEAEVTRRGRQPGAA
jgi:hypothetical protein